MLCSRRSIKMEIITVMEVVLLPAECFRGCRAGAGRDPAGLQLYCCCCACECGVEGNATFVQHTNKSIKAANITLNLLFDSPRLCTRIKITCVKHEESHLAQHLVSGSIYVHVPAPKHMELIHHKHVVLI